MSPYFGRRPPRRGTRRVLSLGPALAVALAVLAGLTLGGCALVSRVQEPSYSVAAQEGSFELRRYGARLVAETVVSGAWDAAGNEAFRRLAGYIFGKNKGRRKLAMTAPVGQAPEPESSRELERAAPVSQRREGQSWIVSFTLPAEETLESAPVPDDARVELRELPAAEVAVVRFSGRWKEDAFAERERELRAWMQARGLAPAGPAEVNRFDPPMMPWFLRRNEVWIPVQRGG